MSRVEKNFLWGNAVKKAMWSPGATCDSRHHLSHVFAHLGISSRKMLAAEIQARNRQLPSRAPQTTG